MIAFVPKAPVRRALADERGVSAVEFALILPVLVMLYLGCVEVSQALTVDRKVTTAAATVGDLVAQESKLCDAKMNNIFVATDSILTPYNSTPLKVVVSYVKITSDGNEVQWSKALHTSAHAVGSELDIPDEVAISELVVAEVEYAYAPTFGQALTDGLTFSDVFYLRPRDPKGLTYAGSC